MTQVNDLESYIAEMDKKSPFIKFEEGIPVEGIYRGAKIVDNTFDPTKKSVEYTLEIDGIKKTFKSGSGNLARMIKPIKDGETIEVVKTGEAFKTRWYVTKK